MGRALATLTAIAALAAAGAAGGAAEQVIVIRVKLCTPSEVRSTVSRFVTAFNAGNAAQLDRVFASERDFRWYSTDAPGERLLPAAGDRSTLLRYFAGRHARGERLTLRSLRVNGNTVASGTLKSYGNFQYTLVREAAELAPTAYQGKGALHCYGGFFPDRLIVWSMARQR
jgi:hypothetical protein